MYQQKNWKCEDCRYLRTGMRLFGSNSKVPEKHGAYQSPCNRYPHNIMRAPKEPACGEFERRK